MTKREKYQPLVEVGFSVNPEFYVKYNRTSQEEKAQLEAFTCSLGGTTANVARVLSNMDIMTRIYALTGPDDELNTVNLQYAIQHLPNNISAVQFNILDRSHLGFTPDDNVKTSSQVFGFKGEIQQNKVQNCLREIQKNNKPNVWKVATGIRPSEFPFVKALFNGNLGFRYLNPRIALIKEKGIFFDLLKETDILVINQAEFDACMNYQELNSIADISERFVIPLIVVTKEKEGGKFYLCNKSTNDIGVHGKYDACFDYITEETEIYPTGSGDWFGGGMLSFIIESKQSAYTITELETIGSMNFGSRVAGKKVTMPGPNNGPKKSDL